MLGLPDESRAPAAVAHKRFGQEHLLVIRISRSAVVPKRREGRRSHHRAKLVHAARVREHAVRAAEEQLAQVGSVAHEPLERRQQRAANNAIMGFEPLVQRKGMQPKVQRGVHERVHGASRREAGVLEDEVLETGASSYLLTGWN